MKALKTGLPLAIVVLLSACGSGTTSSETTSSTRDELLKGASLTGSDTGKAVSIGADELVTITLKAQVSAGYSWQVDGIDSSVLKLAGREQVSAETLGGQDQQILRFAGVAKGSGQIKLAYRRAWETSSKLMSGETTDSEQTFTATVDVAGAYTGSYKDPSATPAKPAKENALSASASSLPSSYTYCDASTCTAIKDQGNCGSCWAFATTGVVEQLEKIGGGTTHALSEQHLVSCNTSQYSCAEGGLQAFPWYYNASDKSGQIGTVYTSDYPYTATDSSCKSKTHHEKLVSWTQMTSGTASTTQLKQAIYDHGAIWVSVCADSSWSSYSGGVYSGSSGCGQTNHAIVLTGWDDSTGTFLLRNSWGSGWGESGYMRIKYGVNGLGDLASYAQYSGGGGSCTPDCTNKVCGSDGCSGTCGSCSSGQTCNSSGQCVSSTNTCKHQICSAGSKLVKSCDTCVTKICKADSYCCSVAWDSICVSEVSSICGQTCN